MFKIGAYFKETNVSLPEPAFLEDISVDVNLQARKVITFLFSVRLGLFNLPRELMIRESHIENINRRLIDRIEILGAISSSNEGLTRVFLSKEMDIASRLIQSWMNTAGLISASIPSKTLLVLGLLTPLKRPPFILDHTMIPS